MDEPVLADFLSEHIRNTPVGEPVIVQFEHLARSIEITMDFVGGWTVRYTIVPGMPIYFVRGEDRYLKNITINFLPDTGLK